jgi:UDPglucose 6-dehydrogenase
MASVDSVLAAKRAGFVGLGRPCFPRDNRALGTYARVVGVEPSICEATDRYNRLHADRMAGDLLSKGLEHYVIDDVAYKPKCPVDIIGESQPMEICKRLVRAGKKVTIRGRYGIVDLVKRTYGRVFQYDILQEEGSDIKETCNPLSSYER